MCAVGSAAARFSSKYVRDDPPASLGVAGLAERLEEREAPRRHGRVEHDVRAAGVDPVHCLAPVGVIDGEVILPDDRAAVGRGNFVNLPVHHVRPDVVRRGQVERPCSRVLDQPRDERFDLLGGHSAGAEQEPVVLLPFVLLRIDVERLALNDRRSLDGLPGRAEDAAQQHVDAVVLDELRGARRRLRVVGCAVLDNEVHATAEQPAGGVDLVHDERGDVGLAGAHDRQGTGLVGDHADLDCIVHNVPPTPRSGCRAPPPAAGPCARPPA